MKAVVKSLYGLASSNTNRKITTLNPFERICYRKNTTSVYRKVKAEMLEHGITTSNLGTINE